MKKWIAIIVATIAMQAQADDFTYKYLVMTDASGTETALSAEGLKLSVANGYLVASNDGETTATFELASLVSMAFAETATSVVTAIDGTLGTAQEGEVEAYNLSGVRLGTFSSMSQLKSALGRGIYIVKQNGTTKKITLK